MLNRGVGLQYSKHTPEGIAERTAILQQYGIDSAAVLIGFKPKQYEDVLDALCLAVSARKGVENGFKTIPTTPVTDCRGLKMQMVFGKLEEIKE